MIYRLPDHPVIARLEREGWPLEPSDWLPEDEYDWTEDDLNMENYKESEEDYF